MRNKFTALVAGVMLTVTGASLPASAIEAGAFNQQTINEQSATTALDNNSLGEKITGQSETMLLARKKRKSRPKVNRPGRAERNQIRNHSGDIRSGKSGKTYENRRGRGQRLPKAKRGEHYQEHDLGQDKNGGRGTHRTVTKVRERKRKDGSRKQVIDGRYSTNDHYRNFRNISPGARNKPGKNQRKAPNKYKLR
ncbi:MAG: ribonuclease domain-containing protein [Cyanobacteria bacterium J06621_15]